MPDQPIITLILGGAAVVLIAWLLLRFSKIIARALLIAAVLTIVIIISFALLTQASANRQIAEAAKTTSLGLSLSLLIIGALVIALLAALGVVGYLWLRLRLTERHPHDTWQPGPNALWRRKQTPLPPAAQPPPVVYLVEPQPTEAVQEGWGFEEWGW